MTTYLVVVNDVAHPTGITRASDIIDFLLARQIWIFSDRAPHLNRITIDDKLVVYAAKKAGSAFLAEMKVASEPSPLQGGLHTEVERLGLSWFSHWIRISTIRRFEPPRPVKPLIPKLEFIVDKKNYGLAFRQGVRRIEETDAKIIVGRR